MRSLKLIYKTKDIILSLKTLDNAIELLQKVDNGIMSCGHDRRVVGINYRGEYLEWLIRVIRRDKHRYERLVDIEKSRGWQNGHFGVCFRLISIAINNMSSLQRATYAPDPTTSFYYSCPTCRSAHFVEDIVTSEYLSFVKTQGIDDDALYEIAEFF
jgi:hypothetical protein